MLRIRLMALCVVLLLVPSIGHGEDYAATVKKQTEEMTEVITAVIASGMEKISDAQQKAVDDAVKRLKDHEESGEVMVGTVAILERDRLKKKQRKRHGGNAGVE